MEEHGSGGHRVQRNRTVIWRLRNSKKTIKHKCGCVAHNCCSEQNFMTFWMPYHAVFGFLIPLLLSLLQVINNNQATNKYSFETHPTNLWVFLLATFVYSVAFAANIQSKFYSINVFAISGSLSSVSLISMFLPGLPGRLIFIPWAFVSVVLSRGFIICICCWLYRMIMMKTFFQIVNIWDRFKGGGMMEQPRLPV
ncbi:hypothetical protein QYF36_026401 [Acer negundo]|nr:hypothetical protein QYF36_026401 [Acer negundo]